MQRRTAFRELVAHFRPEVRLTAQQNILFGGFQADERAAVEDLLRAHGVPLVEQVPLVDSRWPRPSVPCRR
jgi:sulfite reductase (ferredoxin)